MRWSSGCHTRRRLQSANSGPSGPCARPPSRSCTDGPTNTPLPAATARIRSRPARRRCCRACPCRRRRRRSDTSRAATRAGMIRRDQSAKRGCHMGLRCARRRAPAMHAIAPTIGSSPRRLEEDHPAEERRRAWHPAMLRRRTGPRTGRRGSVARYPSCLRPDPIAGPMGARLAQQGALARRGSRPGLPRTRAARFQVYDAAAIGARRRAPGRRPRETGRAR